MKKAHDHLLNRYKALESAYVDLKEEKEQEDISDLPLLSGSGGRLTTPRTKLWDGEAYGANSLQNSYRRRPHATSDPDPYDSVVYNPTSPIAMTSRSDTFPVRLARLDTDRQGVVQPHDAETRSPLDGKGGMVQSPLGKTSIEGAESQHAESLDGQGRPKIKPQSEVRVYGRGKSIFQSPAIRTYYIDLQTALLTYSTHRWRAKYWQERKGEERQREG